MRSNQAGAVVLIAGQPNAIVSSDKEVGISLGNSEEVESRLFLISGFIWSQPEDAFSP